MRIALHILFWLVYVPINAVLACILQRATLEQFFVKAVYIELFSLPVKLALIYFVFYYIIPLYLERSKLGKLIGLLLIAFGIATILSRMQVKWVFFPIFLPGQSINLFNPQGLLLTVFDLFITLAAAVTIKMIRVHYKSLEFEQELIREKLESELNFLRAQTNPHFLFNTLNNLYVLARKKSDKTPEAIMMLSKIMRFMLYECRASRIPVANEAKVIRDYIELEKMRYNQRLSVHYDEDLDSQSTAIAPLLLLPFVENSFKHGAGSTTGDVEIFVRIRLHNQHLSFSVENTVDPEEPAMHNGSNGHSNGIGLKNVQRQLDLIYPQQHQLSAGREDGMYRAHLEVDLNS